MERRNTNDPKGKGAELPIDFTKMVAEVFSNNFEEGLKKLAAIKPDPYFQARGMIFPTEIIVCISLHHKDVLAATSVYCSVDYDPAASSPTPEDLLNRCVDGIGAVYNYLLNSEKEVLQQLADDSLASLENIPFNWTETMLDKKAKVYLKVDKSNPEVDQMTDNWIKENDPKFEEEVEEENKEAEEALADRVKSGKTVH